MLFPWTAGEFHKDMAALIGHAMATGHEFVGIPMLPGFHAFRTGDGKLRVRKQPSASDPRAGR